METIRLTYLGELRTEATHVKSGVKIITDAPPDNQGKGESFSPTDLLATSLGTCMVTLMGIKARDLNLDLKGMNVRVTKVMASDPRRVGEVIIEIDFPVNSFSEKEKILLERTAMTCPVSKSVHPDLKQTVKFNY